MASDDIAKGIEEEQDSSKTKARDDDRRKKYERILDESIDRLVAFSRRLDDLIDSTNSKSLPSLMNTRARVQAELTYLILVAMNPKLKLMPDTLRSRDFAKLIQSALVKEEAPRVAKALEERAGEAATVSERKQVGEAAPSEER
ncbi:MAG TPA: hypothetical protein VFF30_08170 [Nitrososphaerales archaeon]|nr:hypothetical protein [Nitrososphaerales archaeon]